MDTRYDGMEYKLVLSAALIPTDKAGDIKVVLERLKEIYPEMTRILRAAPNLVLAGRAVRIITAFPAALFSMIVDSFDLYCIGDGIETAISTVADLLGELWESDGGVVVYNNGAAVAFSPALVHGAYIPICISWSRHQDTLDVLSNFEAEYDQIALSDESGLLRASYGDGDSHMGAGAVAMAGATAGMGGAIMAAAATALTTVGLSAEDKKKLAQAFLVIPRYPGTEERALSLTRQGLCNIFMPVSADTPSRPPAHPPADTPPEPLLAHIARGDIRAICRDNRTSARACEFHLHRRGMPIEGHRPRFDLLDDTATAAVVRRGGHRIAVGMTPFGNAPVPAAAVPAAAVPAAAVPTAAVPAAAVPAISLPLRKRGRLD